MVLYSVAWAPWVPYAAAMISVVATFALPCVSTSFCILDHYYLYALHLLKLLLRLQLRSIASKQTGPTEQV